MSVSLRFALATFLAVAGGASALAQQPPGTEAEIQALEEKLQQLMRALREQQANKAPNPRPVSPAPAKPKPVEPVIIVPVQVETNPALAHLRGLAKHSDPKVAALAKELLAQLTKATPPGTGVNIPGIGFLNELDLQIEIVPNNKDVPFAIVFGADGKGAAPQIEFKAAQISLVKEEPARAAASSLKISTDGKTAAVVSADGTIVVYDVASGRELMRFPGKK